MRRYIVYFSIFIFMTTSSIFSQENIGYQSPPEEILELVDIERAPIVNIDSRGEQMLFFYRNTFKTLSELNQTEIRLGGLRVNPNLNIASTITYYNNIKYKRIGEAELQQVTGLPEPHLMFRFLPTVDDRLRERRG